MLRPRAAFSSPRSQFFPIRTDPKPANSIVILAFLSYFFVKKIPLSRRVEYVMDGSVSQ